VNTIVDGAFQQRMQRVELLLQQVEGFADPVARETTREVVQMLMDLHGAGLAALLELVGQAGEPGQKLLGAFARNDLIASLLLLYGLHPVDLEERVRLALEQVRPTLQLHKGGVELLSVAEGTVRLKLTGNCDGCPSSAVTLRTTVEEAILAAAPDVTAIEVEEETGPAPLAGHRFSLPVLQRS